MAEGVLAFSITLVLILIAGWVWYEGQAAKKQANLPAGEIVFADVQGRWMKQSESLRADDVGLVGKPDYIIRQGEELIPVELKSSKAPRQPYESHVMQLAAYCLLVEENYGIRPKMGLIQYQDHAFEVPYDDDLEQDLLDIMHEMRQSMFEEDVNRNHQVRSMCLQCGVRNVCDQRLS